MVKGPVFFTWRSYIKEPCSIQTTLSLTFDNIAVLVPCTKSYNHMFFQTAIHLSSSSRSTILSCLRSPWWQWNLYRFWHPVWYTAHSIPSIKLVFIVFQGTGSLWYIVGAVCHFIHCYHIYIYIYTHTSTLIGWFDTFTHMLQGFPSGNLMIPAWNSLVLRRWVPYRIDQHNGNCWPWCWELLLLVTKERIAEAF